MVSLRQISIKYLSNKPYDFFKSAENCITINGVNLQNVDSLCFLGVCIDHQITWKDHTIYILNKLSKSIAITHRAINAFDTKALYCLHKAFFQPHHYHCIEVRENTYESNINPVIIEKKLCELSVILCHWTILLECFVN